MCLVVLISVELFDLNDWQFYVINIMGGIYGAISLDENTFKTK